MASSGQQEVVFDVVYTEFVDGIELDHLYEVGNPSFNRDRVVHRADS